MEGFSKANLTCQERSYTLPGALPAPDPAQVLMHCQEAEHSCRHSEPLLPPPCHLTAAYPKSPSDTEHTSLLGSKFTLPLKSFHAGCQHGPVSAIKDDPLRC